MLLERQYTSGVNACNPAAVQPLQGDLKKMIQNEINIKNTSDNICNVKYANTDRENCFLSITKTIM